MKQVCLLCERTAPDSNLFCQETYCPAEMSPTLLGPGDMLGDIEIVKALMVQRHSVLYEAMHQKQRVLLKVAHPGQENKERIKREAELLQNLQLRKEQDKLLPKLLPPYANTTIARDPYGRSMLQGHLLFFELFEFFEGEPLQDILKKNPQLWIYHIGWILISMATAVAVLNSKGILHLGISTESILMHFDEEQNVPRVQLFDLGLISLPQNATQDWYRYFAMPAYTPPEMLDPASPNFRPDYQTDVYELGLVLYELLVGEPAYTYKLRSDSDVYRAIQRNQRIKMNRVEDVEKIANIALRAVSQQKTARQQNALEFAKELIEHFGRVPPPKPSRWPSMTTLVVITVAIVTIVLLILLAIRYGQ